MSTALKWMWIPFIMHSRKDQLSTIDEALSFSQTIYKNWRPGADQSVWANVDVRDVMLMWKAWARICRTSTGKITHFPFSSAFQAACWLYKEFYIRTHRIRGEAGSICQRDRFLSVTKTWLLNVQCIWLTLY